MYLCKQFICVLMCLQYFTYIMLSRKLLQLCGALRELSFTNPRSKLCPGPYLVLSTGGARGGAPHTQQPCTY